MFQNILVPRDCAPFGQHQKPRPSMRIQILEHAQSNRFIFSANQIRLDLEHAQSDGKSDGKSVNRGLPVLDLPRGRFSWY